MNPQHTAALDRIAPARRPPGRAAGYQRWSDLAFVHWQIEAAAIRRLLPAGLELDTWDGDAWVGLVPFHMAGVRPRGFCAIPGISEFHETNVRTYVFFEGRPGVWFFSLEAACRLAVWVGRWKWNLQYYLAEMQLDSDGPRRHYRSRRRNSPAMCDLTIRIGDNPSSEQAAIAESSAAGAPALPGTLEHFLIERYYLYTKTAEGRLLRGQVHHRPYRLRRAELEHMEETLLAAAGIQPDGPPCHVVYSPGVQVEVFPLIPVA